VGGVCFFFGREKRAEKALRDVEFGSETLPRIDFWFHSSPFVFSHSSVSPIRS